ncbi:MAG: energy-coupled thiamine transporter ThiT [Oscillospiraceae bacterium]|nr:energy-coupled thiamine transporter ThiT [Oscillospiraceae bacterium]
MSSTVHPSRLRLRALCEAAIFVAIAIVLHQLRFRLMPQGGSVSFILVPLVIYSIRWGLAMGLLSSFAFGIIRTIMAGGFAWGWQAVVLDFFVANTVIGLAGLFYRRAGSAPMLAAFVAGLAQYAIHWLAGALIFAEWMPEEFMGMPMGNPWIYSLLYNATYMVPNIILAVITVGLLSVPLKTYIRGEDLA